MVFLRHVSFCNTLQAHYRVITRFERITHPYFWLMSQTNIDQHQRLRTKNSWKCTLHTYTTERCLKRLFPAKMLPPQYQFAQVRRMAMLKRMSLQSWDLIAGLFGFLGKFWLEEQMILNKGLKDDWFWLCFLIMCVYHSKHEIYHFLFIFSNWWFWRIVDPAVHEAPVFDSRSQAIDGRTELALLIWIYHCSFALDHIGLGWMC